jgi:ribonucleoside-diphosphate reductase alpha chain
MLVYSHQEARAATINYFNGDELAADVWISKYALKNEKGELLEKTPVDMHHRLAKEFARIEAKYPNPLSEEQIFDYLKKWEIVPQGSPMSGIGNNFQLQSLSNCFVIESCQDSFGSILKTDEEQCQIMKRRGGVGHDISAIRPSGAPTKNAAKTTDGISAFMERFSNSCRTTAQGGRRGALMLSIDVAHAEIETFIDIKRDRTKVTGANISIRLSDEFMEAVSNDSDFTLRWPVNVSLSEAKVVRTVKARSLWDKIISAAHDCAEPGLLFWDNVLKYGPADIYPEFKSISTNPCGEIALSKYDSCRLLLLNTTKFVNNPFTAEASFDYQKFGEYARVGQKLMDDLVDLELEKVDAIINKILADPESDDIKSRELKLWQQVRTAGLYGRRTGLGLTGLGDCLAMLQLRYGSLHSITTTEKIYETLAVNAYQSSVDMAKDRGAFLAYNPKLEENHPFLNRIFSRSETLKLSHEKYGRRNIALTTTAPAGSVSMLTQTTSGIEPVFRTSYTRRKKINNNDTATKVDFVDTLGDRWQHYEVYHHGVTRWMEITGNSDVTQSPYQGACADQIDWRARVQLQAAAQRWVCHSISSTINLARETTVDEVKEIYMEGWKAGVKGLTVYVDGCRDGVLVSNEEKAPVSPHMHETHAPKRPKELECDIHRATIKGRSYTVLVGLLDGSPYEVFAGYSEHISLPKRFVKGMLVKNGKVNGMATYNLVVAEPGHEDDPFAIKDIVNQFDNPDFGALTRMLSLSLRHGVPIQFACEQLKKDKNSDLTSFNSVIARVLGKAYIKDGLKPTGACSNCGSDQLRYQEGCVTCDACGSSKCG